MLKTLTTSTAPLRVAAMVLVIAGLTVLVLAVAGLSGVPAWNLTMVSLVPLALVGMAVQGLRR